MIRGATWRGIALIGLGALVPAVGSWFLHPRRPVWNQAQAIEEVDILFAQRWKSGVLWIDARPRALFEKDHIPSALLLNLEEWDRQLDGVLDVWKAERPTVVYCGGGDCDSSREVALRLRREAQMENIYILKGGWPAWQAAH